MTTETEMQRQIGSLLWMSDEMKVSTFEDEDIIDDHAGLVIENKDGSKFHIIIKRI